MSSGRLPPPEPIMELPSSTPVTSITFGLPVGGEEWTLYSGHQDGKVIKWNRLTRRPESSTVAHRESVTWLTCVSEKLLTQGRDGVTKFWVLDVPGWTVIGEVQSAAVIICNSSLCSFENQHLLSVPSDSAGQVTTYYLENLSLKSTKIVHTSPPTKLRHKDSKSYGMCMQIKSASGNTELPYLFVAYESGFLTLWDLCKGDILSEVRAHEESVMCMDCWLSGDTGLVKCVTGSVDKQLKLWQVDKVRLTHKQTVHILNPGMSSVSVRGDGKIVALGGWDGNCRVFSFKNLKPLAVLTFHRSTVQCVAFASNNLLATSSKDGYIAIWSIYNT